MAWGLIPARDRRSGPRPFDENRGGGNLLPHHGARRRPGITIRSGALRPVTVSAPDPGAPAAVGENTVTRG